MLAGKLIADMMKSGQADGVSDFLALPEPSRLPQPFFDRCALDDAL